MMKVEKYDRSLSSRVVDGNIRITILTKPNNNDSARESAQMKFALSTIDRVGNYPHVDRELIYTSGDLLRTHCAEEHVGIIYITSGFRDDLAVIQATLGDLNILSATGVPDYVNGGIVLGFDSDSTAGKVKLLINLEQSRRQHIVFEAQLLNLATIIR